MVHWDEALIGVAFGRDERDVGVRSLSCGVAGILEAQLAVAAEAG
jgi:hypothetical protein